MIVSDSAKALFVHVQKTGGLSVKDLLRQRLSDPREIKSIKGRKHATLEAILTAHPELADHFVFGFVRNPWARMYSWHQMVERRRDNAPAMLEKNPFWSGVAERYPDFESFVLRAPDEFGRLRRPQLDYLRHGDRIADFIGRTESLDDDLHVLAERLGLAPITEVPHHNAGPPATYRDHYTPAMRERVSEYFAVDIEAFGYEF